MFKAPEVYQLDQFLRTRFALASRYISHFGAKDYIFQNRAPGKERIFLKNHSRLLLTIYRLGDLGRAASGLLQSRNNLKQGGFSTAGRPNENQKLALLDIESNAAERCHLLFGPFDVPDLADILKAQNGWHQRFACARRRVAAQSTAATIF